ncbi:MAG: metallophosphoesterase [Planctomycetota bacterium]|nr:metallophosphoesterase [Planctomycetota bacterium]
MVVALLAAIACPASAVPYRTVVVFGDTQALVVEREADPSESYLRFLEMTRWVAAHRESENIDFVLHVGDITQHGSVCAIACDEADAQRVNAEWDRFLEGWASIERAHIPYAIVPGNHDNVYPLLTPTPERSTPVDAFASFFGRDEFEGSGTHVATCDADTPDDRCHGFTTLGHVWTFELGSQDVLVAGLPNQPTGGAMAWFEDELKAQPDTPAILLSHQWLRPFDFLWFRYVATGRAGTLGPLTEQVFMTAMGHFTADVQQIVPQGDYRILSVQYDRQAVSGNGDAAILLGPFLLRSGRARRSGRAAGRAGPEHRAEPLPGKDPLQHRQRPRQRRGTRPIRQLSGGLEPGPAGLGRGRRRKPLRRGLRRRRRGRAAGPAHASSLPASGPPRTASTPPEAGRRARSASSELRRDGHGRVWKGQPAGSEALPGAVR